MCSLNANLANLFRSKFAPPPTLNSNTCGLLAGPNLRAIQPPNPRPPHLSRAWLRFGGSNWIKPLGGGAAASASVGRNRQIGRLCWRARNSAAQ